MLERNIQNKIRLKLTGKGIFFRANVGRGWVGDVISRSNGKVTLKNARSFTTGLPAGFSDLFGIRPVKITPDMVGQTIGVFTAIEVKTPKGKLSKYQSHFLKQIEANGGKTIVARCAEDVERL